MPRQIQKLSTSRYLTDDETVEITMQGHRSAFRMRVWRGKVGSPIVPISQLAGGPSPSWGSCQLANLAYQVYLGFSTECTLNFDDEIVHGNRKLFIVEFTPHGHGLRRYLTRAVRRPLPWFNIEELVGSSIEN